ncbi:MAG TPA: zinc-binding dehydrogenase [Streptosporangiaceae bacterium]|jgi:NADPH:quinone reductase-like Zn-dependent oxidoreductase
MRALVATGDRRLVDLAEVPDPVPRPGQVLVDVRAVSVNRGELHRLGAAAPGWRPGWDFAGVTAATTDTGPAPGTRVFGIALGGSWAERVAVPVGQVAAVPGGVPLETAAAVPTAALTALRMLRIPGDLAGRSVLVTGAAGGVGRFAVQLARRSGATVTAVVGRPERAGGLAGLGADQISVGMADLKPGFDLVLESAGGDSLHEALRLVAPRGTVVSYGNSARADTRLPVSDFYPKEAALRGFYVLNDLDSVRTAADLAHLAGLVARDELTVDAAATAGWEKARTVLDDLRARRLAGKAVLRITTEGNR